MSVEFASGFTPEQLEQMMKASTAPASSGQKNTWIKLRGDKTGSNPNDGVNIIRLLPPTTDQLQKGFFPVPAFLHWGYVNENGHKVSYKCPMDISIDAQSGNYRFSGRCPICEQVSSLYDANEESKKKEANTIRRKPQFLYNAIDLTNPKEIKIGVLGVGKELNDSIKNAALGSLRRDGADIYNINSGMNIEILKSGTGFDTNYTVTPLKPSPVAPAILEMCKTSCVDLFTVYPSYTYEGLCEKLGLKPSPDFSARIDTSQQSKTVNFAQGAVATPVATAQAPVQAAPVQQAVPVAQPNVAPTTSAVDNDFLAQIQSKIQG